MRQADNVDHTSSVCRRTAAFPTASMQWSVALPPMALKSPFSDSPREGSASPAATQQQWVAEYQRQARELQANTVRLTQERQRLSEGTSQLQVSILHPLACFSARSRDQRSRKGSLVARANTSLMPHLPLLAKKSCRNNNKRQTAPAERSEHA